MAKTQYWLVLGRNNIAAPTDGQITYMWASANSATSQCKVQIPINGTIKKVRVTLRTSGVGSGELGSAYLNFSGNSNQNLISNTLAFDTENYTAEANMSIAVTTADFINIQITFPTRVTNPTNVVVSGSVLIEA